MKDTTKMHYGSVESSVFELTGTKSQDVLASAASILRIFGGIFAFFVVDGVYR